MIDSGKIRANERVRLVRERPNLRVDSEEVVLDTSASATGARYVVGLVTRVVTEQDLVVSSARMSSRPGLGV
jgi:GH43 family beta-xylosidase